LVEENFSPSGAKKNNIVFNKIKALIFTDKLIPIMFFVLFIFRFSIKLITPIISLFVEMIAPNSNHVSVLTGIMFALTGLMSAFSAMNIGKLIENAPSKNILLLIISLIGSGFFFLAQGFVINIVQFAFLRLCLGLFYGAITPIVNTIISLSTPLKHQGKIFGVSSSITFLGSVFGPITGGYIMVQFNISTVFILAGSLLLITGLIFPIFVEKIKILTFFRLKND